MINMALPSNRENGLYNQWYWDTHVTTCKKIMWCFYFSPYSKTTRGINCVCLNIRVKPWKEGLEHSPTGQHLRLFLDF